MRKSAKTRKEKIKIRGFSLIGGPNPLIDKSYEEVLYLLLNGEPPNNNTLKKFKEEINKALLSNFHTLNKVIKIHILKNKPLILMQILTLSLSTINNLSDAGIIAYNFKSAANILNSYFDKPTTQPKKNLSLVENLLYMIGKNYKDKTLVKHFSRMLISWIDIGVSPSCIATIVNASSRSDKLSAITAGIGNASGKKHTSARIGAMKMIVEIENSLLKNNISLTSTSRKDKKNAFDLIKQLIQKKLTSGDLIPGFGHYIFKGTKNNEIDPRIIIVEKAIKEIWFVKNICGLDQEPEAFQAYDIATF